MTSLRLDGAHRHSEQLPCWVAAALAPCTQEIQCHEVQGLDGGYCVHFQGDRYVERSQGEIVEFPGLLLDLGTGPRKVEERAESEHHGTQGKDV